MTDVFITSAAAPGSLRWLMFELVVGYWSEVRDNFPGQFAIRVVQAGGTPLEKKFAFERERRIWAEEKSRSDLYILTDDDVLPMSLAYPTMALYTLEHHPRFGQMSFLHTNEPIGRWAAADLPGYEVYEDSDVREHEGVGGCRVCRKGLMKEWPEIDGRWGLGYDPYHSVYLRSQGYRVGYLEKCQATHLGRGFSEFWATAGRIKEKREATAVSQADGCAEELNASGV